MASENKCCHYWTMMMMIIQLVVMAWTVYTDWFSWKYRNVKINFSYTAQTLILSHCSILYLTLYCDSHALCASSCLHALAVMNAVSCLPTCFIMCIRDTCTLITFVRVGAAKYKVQMYVHSHCNILYIIIYCDSLTIYWLSCSMCFQLYPCTCSHAFCFLFGALH